MLRGKALEDDDQSGALRGVPADVDPVEGKGVRYEDAGLMLGDAGGLCLFECRSCPGRRVKVRYDCA